MPLTRLFLKSKKHGACFEPMLLQRGLPHNLLHVMQLLDHRNIKNTLIYTQLVNFESDDYHSTTAQNIEEATKLIETGFEYVCTHDNAMLFRNESKRLY